MIEWNTPHRNIWSLQKDYIVASHVFILFIVLSRNYCTPEERHLLS